jgi:Ti type entry exclusion protein TrbK
MVNHTIPIALAAVVLSAAAASGATWLALHEQLCAVPPSPDAASLQEMQKRHEEFFKPQPLDNTHGQEMKPRW